MITGTDTGVGKTYLGCRMAAALSARGLVVKAVKPIESGCAGPGAGPEEDGALLAQASGQATPGAALVRLPDPVAPPLAADRAGVILDWDDVVRGTRAAIEGCDVALVEGAGGLLSPLTWQHTTADLARQLGASAVLVAADRLGAINHIRLTLRALDQAGIRCVGIVLSAPVHEPLANAGALRSLPDLPPLFELPRGGAAPWAGDLVGDA